MTSSISALDGRIDDAAYNIATTAESGLMSASDKTKLDGIDSGAQVNAVEEFWVDGVKQTITGKKISLDLSGKVDKVSGKQLSTEDFTTSEKTKLAGIESGAEPNVIAAVKVDGTALTVTNKSVNINLSGKVDTVSGKGLSTNDYTTADKNKLAAIENGAQANVVEEILIDGTKQSVTDKKVSLDLSGYAKKSDVASVYKLKGSVNAFSNLPTNADTGDVYNIKTAGGTDTYGTAIKAGDNVAWNGSGWDVLAGTVDLSGYVEKESGKGLSTNDYTTSEKNKLAGIAANANNYTLPNATASTLGGVKIGSGISVSSGVISVPTVTSSANGLMSSADKSKLDGIATGANNYTLPTATSSTLGGVKIGSGISVSSGVISVPTVTSSANGLMSSADKTKLDGLKNYTAGNGLALNGNEFSVTLSGGVDTVFTGASSSASGKSGLVPAPASGKQASFLRGDGTWAVPTDTNTTYSAATTTTAGLMSAADKQKLNNLASITTAGDNITISGGKISGTANTIYTAGNNITISGTTISGTANTTYSAATTTTSGLMSADDKKKLNNLASITSAGTGVTISGGTISATAAYTLPAATSSTLGGIKVGNGLSMNGDSLNCTLTGVDDLETWNAANLYLRPAVLGSTSSTVNGAIWYVSDSGTSGSSNVVVFGTTASTLEGAVWFA